MDQALIPIASHRNVATQRDWEAQKPIITRLYLEEGKTLAKVMDIMEREYGFRAS
jgi:hypothetical protein